MAYANNIREQSHLAQPGLVERLARWFGTGSKLVEQRRVYRLTLRELGALNDRDLADLGIHRAMIDSIAREAAYGK